MPRILVITANSKTTPLQLADELRVIRRSIGDQSNFTILHEGEVKAQDLIRRLLEDRPEIMHFAGHGASDEAISLSSEDGQEAIMTSRMLGIIFEHIPIKPRLVILNACFTSEFSDELTKWVDAVIGAEGKIGDKAARRFASNLYAALAQACSVRSAFELAQVELQIHGGKYDQVALNHRPGVDPGSMVFYAKPELLAKFLLAEDGTPKINDDKEYCIHLWLRGVDQYVDSATYQVCHDSFKEESFWEVTRSENASFYTDDFSSAGDVTVRVVAWSKDRGVGVESTLATALRRHYGTHSNAAILEAIGVIDEN